MRAHLLLLVVPLGLLLGSCTSDPVPPTLTEDRYCRERAAIDCEAFYNCNDEDRRASVRQFRPIGTSESECVANLNAACMATPFACPGDQIFQLQIAGACVRALQAVSCDDWRRETFVEPAACTSVCIEDPF